MFSLVTVVHEISADWRISLHKRQISTLLLYFSRVRKGCVFVGSDSDGTAFGGCVQHRSPSVGVKVGDNDCVSPPAYTFDNLHRHNAYLS